MTQDELILSELAQTREEMAKLRSLLLTLVGKDPEHSTGTRKEKVGKYRRMRAQDHIKKNLS